MLRIDADYKTTLDYSFDEESGSYFEINSFKDTGLTLKAGVILNKNYRISVVYFNYSKYNVDKSISGSMLDVDYDYKVELEDSTSMFVGINYKF